MANAALWEQLDEQKKSDEQREKEFQLSYELLADQKQQIKALQAEIKDLKETIDTLKQFDSFASTEGREKDRQIERLVDENSLLKECQEQHAKLVLENTQLEAANNILTGTLLTVVE